MAAAQPEQEREEWRDQDCQLVVTQPEGWMCRVSLKARVDLPPPELYDLLTQPDNSKLFRGIKALKSRKVLRDDRRGRQTVEVTQEAVWKFLCFGGTFDTRLIVDQDKRAGQVSFRLLESGMMKRFEGTWHIQPVSAATASAAAPAAGPTWMEGPWQTLRGVRERFVGGPAAPEASLLTLEQSLLPNVVPPKPLDRLLKGIAARQVRNLVEDVRNEARRLQSEKRKQEHPRPVSASVASLSCSAAGGLWLRSPPAFRRRPPAGR